MLFNSMQFLIFFPIVSICYYVIPHKLRHFFLLACSYYFYMCWNPKYALLMLTSTVITYLSGLLLEAAEQIEDERKRIARKKLYTFGSFGSNLMILFLFKYMNFATHILTTVFAKVGIQMVIPQFDVLLPVGISFYTFQALSYTMDVYRREICAEKNFFKYALFVSFFPQLVAGPIERSKNLIHQVSEKHTFQFVQIRAGLFRMLFGLFQKVVLSEYLAIVVNTVYDSYTERSGYQLAIATICFAFQIYCDFGSYSNIAIGAAQVMGFRLMENFDTPYLSQSVAEFWRRWHISLSTWFRDYLYFPLGGSRKGKLRTHINKMIVFLVSGLWHGASGHFVIWGFLNGIYQVIGEVLMPIRKKLFGLTGLRESWICVRVVKMLITFALVDFSWIFFRASFSQSISIIHRIFRFDGNWIHWGSNLSQIGIDEKTLWVLMIALVILLITDIMQYCGKNFLIWVEQRQIWLRWIIYYAFIFGILIFGVYGPGFDESQFIYFQF